MTIIKVHCNLTEVKREFLCETYKIFGRPTSIPRIAVDIIFGNGQNNQEFEERISFLTMK